jgi:hypothetical protein
MKRAYPRSAIAATARTAAMTFILFFMTLAAPGLVPLECSA